MRPFLVCYDYGTGGLWWWIMANSAEDITATYREVTVLDQAPPWWTDDIDREVPRREISNEPDSALALLLRNAR